MATTSLINAGLIPLEAITTMGINAKEGENPIGFFGTGLKYAIASLLRTGQGVSIWRGLERYDFAPEGATIRGKEFEFIVMRGPEGEQRLGFTTHLGATWEMWQVFRELFSNCLDEGGDLFLSEVDPAEDHTCIQVTGEAFAEAARGRERYFLATEPLFKGTLVDIHPSRSTGLYYRGVLVGSLPMGAGFTYNLKTGMDLTEDRTLKARWQADSHIAYTIENCTDRALIERILVGAGDYENALDLSQPGPDLAEVVLALTERMGLTAVSPTARKGAERWAQREARVKDAVLSRREIADIAEAKAFLKAIGYEITAPVTIAETLGPDVFGMAKDGKIFIAKIAITRGGNFLIGTLLEEHLHITHGFHDESRRFQDFLIDLVVKFAKDAAFERGAA